MQLDLLGEIAPVQFRSIETTAKQLEAFETPRWAAIAGLKAVPLQKRILDPCVGRGMLAGRAIEAGHEVRTADIYPWEYEGDRQIVDFLSPDADKLVEGWEEGSFDVFVNPPFSMACDFIDRSLELGARKSMCFQRFAWLEAGTRRKWWDKSCCKTVYVCARRATCWGFHIDPEDRVSSTPTAHAWFEFDRDWSGPPTLKRLYD